MRHPLGRRYAPRRSHRRHRSARRSRRRGDGRTESRRAVRDEINGCRDRRQHEARVDVASGKERQRGQLRERLARGVRVDRRRARHAGVQGEQQVERLGVADLADDEAVGPHAQRLLDEAPQRHLAGALEAGLPALQRDEVGCVDGELERLLDRDDPVMRAGTRRSARRAASSCPRAWRRRPGCCGRSSSPARRTCWRPRARASRWRRADRGRGTPGRNLRMLTDQCAPGDVGDHDVQAAAVRHRGVHERLTQVDAATRGVQHPLDEVADRSVGQGESGGARRLRRGR